MKVAIMIDGGFYRRRAQSCLGEKTAQERANELIAYCHRHLKRIPLERTELYRIF